MRPLDELLIGSFVSLPWFLLVLGLSMLPTIAALLLAAGIVQVIRNWIRRLSDS